MSPIRKWQFDVVFAVFVLGAVFLVFAKTLGVTIDSSALTGYGAICTYVLTQRNSWTKTPDDPTTSSKSDEAKEDTDP